MIIFKYQQEEKLTSSIKSITDPNKQKAQMDKLKQDNTDGF
jgi:hypothetical protein